MEEYLNEIALAEKIFEPQKGECPYTLFLGAGASTSSGIPTTHGMIRRWQELLYKSITNRREVIEGDKGFGKWITTDFNRWVEEHISEGTDTPYSLLFSYFYQQPKERQLFIEQLVEGKKPSFGYLYLAGLIADRRFNRVLTTNFDDLLNDALTSFYQIKPIICAFDSAVAGIRVASQRPKIIKLHGDFLYDNIRNMKHDLKSLDSNMEEKMYEMCKDFGLIIVGYSGEDESIMAPLRDMIRKPEYLNMGLHWCIHKRPDGSVPLPKKLKDLKNYHGDRVHIYSIDSFDCLMEEIFLRCKSKLPDVLTDPHRYSISKSFYESVRHGSSQALTSYMRKCLSDFVESARSQIDISEFEVIQADMKWELGAEERNKGNQHSAEELFLQGFEILENFLSRENSSLDLRVKALRRKSGLCIALAKIYKKRKKDSWKMYLEEALEVVREGINIVESNSLNLPLSILRSFPYNGCCAHSLFAEWQGSFDAPRKAQVKGLFQKIKKLDPEENHIFKLLNDADFLYATKNSKDEDWIIPRKK